MGKLLRVSRLCQMIDIARNDYISYKKTAHIKTRKIIQPQNILILKGSALRNKLGRKSEQCPQKVEVIVVQTNEWL